MGEAVYHLKARWPTERAAKAALPKVREFLVRLGKAYDDWQANRGFGDKGNKTPKDYFQKAYQEKYGDVLEKLGIKIKNPEEDPAMNQLAGQLSGPVNQYQPVEECLDIDGAVIHIHGETWHLADWDNLALAMERHFGATHSKWISEEYADVGALLQV